MVGEGQGMKGKEGKRTSECSHSSTFATTPLIVYSVKKYKKFLVPQNLDIISCSAERIAKKLTNIKQTNDNQQTNQGNNTSSLAEAARYVLHEAQLVLQFPGVAFVPATVQHIISVQFISSAE